MAQNSKPQIFDSINKATRILIALPSNANGDALGAGLALFAFLGKLDKEVEIATASENLEAFAFLPGIAEVKHELEVMQSFVISVATNNAQLEELSYEAKSDHVEIFLKPKAGKFSESDVSFRSGRFPYDLIIVLHATSLEQLGRLYDQNTDLFFETPIINIDHHPGNEYFGQINYVDVTATSAAEIVSLLIDEFESSLMDEHIATALLTGIIVETNSFQHAKTTPRAFNRASQLIAQGGRHQDIIRELYKTKSISLLKLWGRALARLKEEPDLNLVYSLVNHTDIEKTGSQQTEIFGVVKELAANLSGVKLVLFLAEVAPQEIVGYLHVHPSINREIVASALSAQMLNGALGRFTVSGANLLDVEKDVLEKLRKIQKQISNP